MKLSNPPNFRTLEAVERHKLRYSHTRLDCVVGVVVYATCVWRQFRQGFHHGVVSWDCYGPNLAAHPISAFVVSYVLGWCKP